ncbi:FAD-dependent oxidoreductase [Paenibacillaceae bacterium WGS1546]|uniref:FAD-dependent oxidoreductase n=1 Tax=Cohnella sp. WGS1546 TaxID=3366810 RepID=UPI00372D4A06
MERILIVGGGPIGLALGVSLVRRGVPITIVDKQPEISTFPKASTVHAPTLEILEEWGLLEPLMKIGRIADKVQYWNRSTEALIAEFDLRKLSAHTPHPYRLHVDQHYVSKVLYEYLLKEELADIRFETELIGLTQDESGVEATLTSAAGKETLRFPFAIGADGISSTVRKLLGIAFTGHSNPHYHLLMGLKNYEIADRFSRLGYVAMFLHPTDWVDMITNKDMLKVIIPLTEAQIDNVDERMIRDKLKEIDIVKEGFDLFYHTVYKTHQLVADRMVQGRVVLIGDAAHVNVEFGGMGMNSGIHDAYSLADKLYAALQGENYKTLFESFERLRMLVTKESVQKTTIANTELIQNTEKKQEELKKTAADDELALRHMLRITMIEGFRLMLAESEKTRTVSTNNG